MTAKPEPQPLPGDVVQVTDKTDRWFMALLVVEEFRSWGLKTHALVPTAEEVVPHYYRIGHGKYLLVGTSRLLDGETAKAREEAIKTAKLVAAEKEEKD